MSIEWGIDFKNQTDCFFFTVLEYPVILLKNKLDFFPRILNVVQSIV